MKSLSLEEVEANTIESNEIVIRGKWVFGAIIINRRTARALGEWLVEVGEPPKTLPPPEVGVGSRVVIKTAKHNMLNLPGVITSICPTVSYPYNVDVTMPGGRVEPMMFDRTEFDVERYDYRALVHKLRVSEK